MIEITSQIAIPRGELQFSFSRSAGPGGQNVNKLNTKVTLHWDVQGTPSLPEDVRRRFLDLHRTRINREGQLVLSSQQTREQSRNVEDCINKLRALVLAAARPPKLRRETRPSRGSKERRLQGKRLQARKKQSRRPPRMDD